VVGNMEQNKLEKAKQVFELLKEVGDLSNIIPVEIFNVSIDDQGITADFTLTTRVGEEVTGDIFIEKLLKETRDLVKLPPVAEQDNVFNIGYAVGGNDAQYMQKDAKTLFSILRAVLDLVQLHTKQVGGDVTYLVGATDKKAGANYNDPQKKRLYHAIISQNVPSGWRVGLAKFLGHSFTYISNKK
jgi:hypothetical protein